MFITNHAAMKIQDNLVIADLHIGAEYEIMKSGIRVRQVEDLIERTLDLIKLTKTRNLILLGDVKHNVPFLKYEEKRSVPLFLREVGKKAKVTIVPGNHDGSIGELCPHTVKIAESSGILIGDYGLLHGHARPSEKLEKAKKFIVGHNHPLFRFEDAGGAWFFRQVWIKGNIKDGRELIIMPAFSRLVGGMDINRLKNEKDLMGPLAKQIDLRNSEIHLLDGSLIGKFKNVVKFRKK
jgi:putative SbcD/Mre11-related phosphoesterase